ncbi:MAG: response regulator transcription factor [Lachnospiraceae bacterium]|nr:response regulator transcription factor [Lachnospiraceae bacterium]
MKYNIAICDDEQNQIEYLSALVNQWALHAGKIVNINFFYSAEEFLFHYEDKSDYDILLLDIEMKDISGIELAKRIRKKDNNIQIVFITGYPEFISEGYEVAALHYLLKPVTGTKLGEVLDRAACNIHKKEQAVLVYSGKCNQRILLDSIIYAEVLSHQVTIHTTSKEYKTKLSISEMEKMLGKGFIRCHRSYIAGICHIAKITRNEIVFDDGRTVPLARSAYQMANQMFIEYYKE